MTLDILCLDRIIDYVYYYNDRISIILAFNVADPFDRVALGLVPRGLDPTGSLFERAKKRAMNSDKAALVVGNRMYGNLFAVYNSHNDVNEHINLADRLGRHMWIPTLGIYPRKNHVGIYYSGHAHVLCIPDGDPKNAATSRVIYDPSTCSDMIMFISDEESLIDFIAKIPSNERPSFGIIYLPPGTKPSYRLYVIRCYNRYADVNIDLLVTKSRRYPRAVRMVADRWGISTYLDSVKEYLREHCITSR